MKLKNLLFTLALFSVSGALAQTTVSALITTNQVWTSSGSPYIIGQNTYIDSNVSVKIEGGVTVEFTGNYKLLIDGEIQAIGDSSGDVTFLDAQLEFRDASEDFNALTYTGAYFYKCNFKGPGVAGRRTIALRNTSILVDRCKFDSTNYGIYGNSNDISEITIRNSDFQGLPSGYGYPLYCSGSKTVVDITNSTFRNAYYIYAYGLSRFENNTVENMKSVSFYIYDRALINCNQFLSMQNGLQVSFYAFNTPSSATITYNTFDSVGSTNGYQLKINRSSTAYRIGNLEVNYNNFLGLVGGSKKVLVYGSNPTPTTSDTLDFTNNYWSTTNSSTIDSFITDYNDDIKLFGIAHYSPFLGTNITSCSYTNPCPTANFYISQMDNILVFYDSSSAQNSYTTTWYVDGTRVGTGQTFTYVDSSEGTHTVCLVIEDTSLNCKDTACLTYTITSNSLCSASYYLAVDSTNKYNLFLVNNSTGTSSSTKYTWSFGDGNGSTLKNPTHKYNSFGVFQLCLTIEDSLARCYSTYCDSIGMDSTGAVFKAEGFTLTVIDEDDLLSIEPTDFVSNFNVYPNPSSGSVELSINAKQASEMKLRVFNGYGAEVYSADATINTGINSMSLDLSNETNGMYIIQLSTEYGSVTKRIIVQK